MIDARELHNLAEMDTRPHPMVSLYLALDQTREARLQGLSDLVTRKKMDMNGNGSRKVFAAVADDLEEARRYLEEMEPDGAKGLSLFSCRPQGFFAAYTLPMAVANRLEIGPIPYIRPLGALTRDFACTLAVVADSRSARFFVGSLGELQEFKKHAIENQAPASERDGDRGRTMDSHLKRRAEEAARNHHKEIAQKAMELMKAHQCQGMVIGGPKGTTEGIVAQLHPFLLQRLEGVFSSEVSASKGQVARAAALVQEEARAQRQDRLMNTLGQNLGPRGQATSGLNEVLASLYEGKVHTLLVDNGFTQSGGACPSCGRLRHVAGPCPMCGTDMTRVHDVINLAVARAIDSGAVVEELAQAPGLQQYGNVAALLRYV